MKASEALARFYGRTLPCAQCGNGSCESCQERSVMRSALLAAVEREERGRPKATLTQMAEACRLASELACGPHVEWLASAYDTLRKLDEEGGALLARFDRGHTPGHVILGLLLDLFRSLGVEPKP